MRGIVLIVLCFSAILSACASLAGPGAPSWVLSTPKPDGNETYFVGSASAPGKDLTRATDDATANLVASIMRYIGVKVTVESSATARATLDSYTADIRQTVTTEASNRIAGFSVKDRYSTFEKASGKTTVYLLVAYKTADLEREKARIAAAFVEKTDAVAKPEAEGKAHLAAGRNWDALGSFVNAALAASGSDIDNAAIKVERNLANARDALKSLRILASPPKAPIFSGTPYPEGFQIRLVSGSDSRGVPGATLLVSYPRKQGARILQRTVTATTDAEGLVAYTPPPPDFVGVGRLSVRIDFSAQTTLLDGLPVTWAPASDALREAFGTAAVDVDFTVLSHAREIPTCVFLVDLDENGNQRGESVAMAALSETLGKAGFALVPAGLDGSLIIAGNDEVIRAEARISLGSRALRLIYGSARVLGARKDGAMWIVDARVAAKAVELESGRILWSGERQVSALGNDESAALRAALREAGAAGLGKELLTSLDRKSTRLNSSH